MKEKPPIPRMKRMELPPTAILANPYQLHDYFWRQREGYHALSLETDPNNEWHIEKLSHARMKLADGYQPKVPA
jgi:hypothetical protein